MKTRRQFLGAAGLAATAPLLSQTSSPAVKRSSGGDLLSRMAWMNKPAQEQYSEGELNVRAHGKTDFWRKTFFGYITDNGHFMYLRADGDFTFQARVNGNYSSLYDQAGLMVRLDEKHWMKCGTELVEEKRWASVVFTHDYSDWSTMEDLSQRAPVYWRVARRKDSIEAQCSVDGAKFLTIRQGYFPAKVPVMVGVMCAAPEGGGFDATFDQLSIEPA